MSYSDSFGKKFEQRIWSLIEKYGLTEKLLSTVVLIMIHRADTVGATGRCGKREDLCRHIDGMDALKRKKEGGSNMLPLQDRVSFAISKSYWLQKITHQNSFLCFCKKIYFDIRHENSAKKLQKYGYEMLEKVFQIADKHGFIFWIDWGTLLGYVRDGEIIPHDDDLDIGTFCMKPDVHECFVKEMEAKGVHRVREWKNGDLLVGESFEYKGVLVDVDYYFENGDYISWYMFEVSEKTKILHEDNQEKLSGMEIYRYDFSPIVIKRGRFKNGTKCNIPVEAGKRVVEMYGSEWSKPDKNYDWHKINNYVYEGFSEGFTGWRIK